MATPYCGSSGRFQKVGKALIGLAHMLTEKTRQPFQQYNAYDGVLLYDLLKTLFVQGQDGGLGNGGNRGRARQFVDDGNLAAGMARPQGSQLNLLLPIGLHGHIEFAINDKINRIPGIALLENHLTGIKYMPLDMLRYNFQLLIIETPEELQALQPFIYLVIRHRVALNYSTNPTECKTNSSL